VENIVSPPRETRSASNIVAPVSAEGRTSAGWAVPSGRWIDVDKDCPERSTGARKRAPAKNQTATWRAFSMATLTRPEIGAATSLNSFRKVSLFFEP